jgi:hypothetical protein
MVGEEGPEPVLFRGGERVIPNHLLGGSNDNALIGEVRSLRTEMAGLRSDVRDGNRYGKETADAIDGAARGKRPLKTKAVG